MGEKDILNQIQLAFSRVGARLFRNNTGMGWVGRAIRAHKKMLVEVEPGDVVIKKARALHAGICDGGSDLIGWTPLKITAADVGKTVAVFTAVEVKYGKTATTPQQFSFHNAVIKSGGFSKIARSVDEALEVINVRQYE